jgi:hypothetical protein
LKDTPALLRLPGGVTAASFFQTYSATTLPETQLPRSHSSTVRFDGFALQRFRTTASKDVGAVNFLLTQRPPMDQISTDNPACAVIGFGCFNRADNLGVALLHGYDFLDVPDVRSQGRRLS